MQNDEYILRSDALKAVCENCSMHGDEGEPCSSRCEDYALVLKIPAADVEPKRKSGRWIIAGAYDDFYQCPECGEMWPIFSTIEWKCCPICECKIITNRPKGEDDE